MSNQPEQREASQRGLNGNVVAAVCLAIAVIAALLWAKSIRDYNRRQDFDEKVMVPIRKQIRESNERIRFESSRLISEEIEEARKKVASEPAPRVPE